MWKLLIIFAILQVLGVQSMGDIGSTERFNYFNIELLQEVNDFNGGNIVISPLSIKTALMILSEGSGGKTRDELLTTLRLPSDIMQIRAISKQILLPLLNTMGGSEINLANRLWVNYGAPLSNNFNNLLRMFYGGDTKSVDFSNVMQSSAIINEWVRKTTRNHIPYIVDPGTLSPETQVLLTSALYFRGKWLNSFDPHLTRNQCFKVPDHGCKQVPTMENLSFYRYANLPSLKAEIVEIPYSDGRMSMLVMLPNEEGLQNLHILSKDLSYTSISTILGSLRDTELLLHLPRFTIESHLDLVPVLDILGIRDLFTLNANLTGLLPRGAFRIGSVLHNAKIEVNEQGTIAAAATASAIVPLIGVSYEFLWINRPFLFVLVDRQTSNMIFAGRVVQP